MDRYQKRLQTILFRMAYESPNEFLNYVYHSGMEHEEVRELKYLVDVARRAPGYDPTADPLKIHGIC